MGSGKRSLIDDRMRLILLLTVKEFAASLGALRAVVDVLKHDILFINREARQSDGMLL